MEESSSERQDSLLTDWYRHILWEDPDPSDAVRKAREQMRDRVRVGINDFGILNQYIREDDLDQIFKNDDLWTGSLEQVREYGEDGEGFEFPEPGENWPYVGAFHAIQFFYRGFIRQGMSRREFGDLFRSAVKFAEAEIRDVPVKEISVSGDLSDGGLTVKHYGDYDTLSPYEKLEEGLTLADEDWATLREDLLEHYDSEELLGENMLDLLDEIDE